MAINKFYLAKGPSEDSGGVTIKWEAQTYSHCPQRFNGVVLARNHTFQPNNTAWKPIGKGPCITYTPSEVEMIRVTIGDKVFYYEGIPNRLGEIYWAIRPCQGLPIANHHFLLFIPDDPENFNLPNPGLANCAVIPRMKIITIGGDAGDEIRYKKKLKIIPAAGTVYYRWVYESLSPPFDKAGVASKYIDCLTDMVYHKNDQPDIVAVGNWFKNRHDQKFTNFTNILTQRNKECFKNILNFSQKYNGRERYLTNPPTNRNPKNTANGSNCASLVSSILQYNGATWAQVLEAANTNGIDVGERRLIPLNRFNP